MDKQETSQPRNRAAEQWRPGIGRTIGFVLFGLLLFPCVGAAISPIIMFAVVFIFGPDERIVNATSAATFLMSAVMTFGLARQAWKAKPYQRKGNSLPPKNSPENR